MPLVIRAHGVRYRIEDPGGLIGKSLRAGNPYEARVLEHIYRQGLKGVAVDAGASVGNHALWFAAVCGLRVVAFEPLVYEQLLRNVALNGLGKQIRVQAVALGASAGTATPLGRGQLEPGQGSVPVEPLDGFELADVALLKVDVEGMEADVLEGALDTIRRCEPLIFAEAWDHEAHARVAGVLEPLGYRHVKTYGATPLEEWACSP